MDEEDYTSSRAVPLRCGIAHKAFRTARPLPSPPGALSNHQLKFHNMHNTTLKTLLAATMLCACTLAAAQTGQGMQDRGVPGDRYGYAMHNGKRDVFTEGARGNGQRDVFTDGAYGTRKPDPYTDGARNASPLNLAGMDLHGVSQPPAHSA